MKNVNAEKIEKIIVKEVEKLKEKISLITDVDYKVSDIIIDMILNGATETELEEAVVHLTNLKKKYQRHHDKEAYGSLRHYKVGDQIEVDLKGFGVFTATVQKIEDDDLIFTFDKCISKMPMNYESSNKGGYDKSGLCYWINTVLKDAFPEEIRQHITYISLPTYGQIFGHDSFYETCLEPDNDSQFELMEKRENRIANCEDHFIWYWLYNSTKSAVSASGFAYVGHNGVAACSYASDARGVRPVFALSV